MLGVGTNRACALGVGTNQACALGAGSALASYQELGSIRQNAQASLCSLGRAQQACGCRLPLGWSSASLRGQVGLEDMSYSYLKNEPALT